MARADLHVHSRYSASPADAVLKKFGTQESYTEIDEIYRSARERGMDFVTVTDHNAIGGALELVRRYPSDTFTGVESTVAFPEDGCAVHILVYNFTEAQFKAFDALRHDIYKFRDYLRSAGLAYSVAHASYSVNGRLTLAHIEKLMLLFDVFETINGARVAAYNDLFKKVLQSLTLEKVEVLRQKHLIEPMGPASWRKSFTGGSDEHAGLFIGATWTSAEATDRDGFLAALRAGQTDSGGRSNHYKTQVYTFLKIAYQFSRTRKGGASKKIWDELCAAIFDGKRLGWKIRLKMEQLKRSRKPNMRRIATNVSELVRHLAEEEALPHEKRIDLIYTTVAAIEDAFFVENFEALREGFARGDLLKLMSSVTAVFRSLFLALPFLGTFRHLHQSSALMTELRLAFLGPLPPKEKKILWFTDTLEDLNGVSVTLSAFEKEAAARGFHLKLAAIASPGAEAQGRLNLPAAYEYIPEFYPTYRLRFPSLLRSLEMIFDEAPTEIIVSTPGPAGLVGILAARLFGIPCRGVYHSGFTRMAELGLSGGSLASLVQGVVRWFYGRVDEILVPTEKVIEQLTQRGYERGRCRLFDRGIDRALFAPVAGDRKDLRACYGLDGAFTLIYAGRMSADKGLSFLVKVYREVLARGTAVNLILAGEGPLFEELKGSLAGLSGVRFTGRMAPDDMPLLYSVADLLVFPSTMDTFGMSVLEAQSCALPALVSDAGGPQEVIEPGVTGWAVAADNGGAWVSAIVDAERLWRCDPSSYGAVRSKARFRATTLFDWDRAITALFAGKAGA